VSALQPDDDRTVLPSAPRTVAPAGGNALPPGTRLGEFEIAGLVGEGGFGIVYLAYDHSLERNIALKEYMPSSLAQREGGVSVAVKSPHYQETFALGMRSFINEAKLLAQFDHPSLVKVFRFWEGNGTAYMAMPYYEGVTLKETLRRLAAPPDEAWLGALLTQLLEALAVIHARQCYHRDIAPDNVLMLPGDTPVLLDFGAARRVLNDRTQALTVILKPGYAPIEQYAESPNMKQGPWTDLYALASVIYFAITGRPPAPAVARAMNDPVTPLVDLAAGRYSETFLCAIDAAMAVNPEDRPQNIAEFLDALGCGPLRNHPALRTQPARAAPAGPGRTAVPQQVTRAPTAAAPTTQHAGAPAPGDAVALERLLAGYIGPMAKIIVGRAQPAATSHEDLLLRLGESIDGDEDRAAFLSAARRLVTR
jgi:serine/threonine protein kinase